MAMKKYVNTLVDSKLLEKLKNEMDAEKAPNKYGKYKVWQHYANLQAWQQQGWHFAYINNAGKEMHCTCGLAVAYKSKSNLSTEVLNKLAAIELDQVQRIKGHRNFPRLNGRSTAIIINLIWVEEDGHYLWDVICQGCGESALTEPEIKAKEFVAKHNKTCRFWFSRLGFRS
jgi:hypothetical protein